MTLETRPEVVTPRDQTGAVGGGTPMSITALSQTLVCRYDALLPERGVARADVPTVASPMFKQVFDLRTGECLDDPSVALPVYQAEVVDDMVRILDDE